MRKESIGAALSQLHDIDERNVWQWAEADIDFSRNPAYECEAKIPYDADMFPFWKEPVEAVTDRSVEQVWILKPTRCGASENCLLNPIRYAVAHGGYHVLYITGNQTQADQFFDSRIKAGLNLSNEARQKLARATKNDAGYIQFEDGSLTCTFSRNKSAFKGSGFNLILADEISMWPDVSATAMLKRRGDNFAFPTLIGISSMDPAAKRRHEDDPIWVEVMAGDQRKYFMPDPANGKPFIFELGRPGEHGLQWDQSAQREDGSWDYDRVTASAHYITPSGTRIEESDRLGMVKRGAWQPTASGSQGRKTYILNSFYVPFRSGSFGAIAVQFLESKRRGPLALKQFFYETLSEPFEDKREQVNASQIMERVAPYIRGQSYFDNSDHYRGIPSVKMMGCDVQQNGIYWMVTAWTETGVGCLVDYGFCLSFEDVQLISLQHKPEYVLVDSGFRTYEVYAACKRFNFTATKGTGATARGTLPYSCFELDPWTGTRARTNDSIWMIVFEADVFKDLIAERLRGENGGFFIFTQPEKVLSDQLTSEKKDPSGRWVKVRVANHLWDCMILNIIGAVWNKIPIELPSYSEEYLTRHGYVFDGEYQPPAI
jgi:phage terminase large subunit GpA-like protein